MKLRNKGSDSVRCNWIDYPDAQNYYYYQLGKVTNQQSLVLDMANSTSTDYLNLETVISKINHKDAQILNRHLKLPNAIDNLERFRPSLIYKFNY